MLIPFQTFRSLSLFWKYWSRFQLPWKVSLPACTLLLKLKQCLKIRANNLMSWMKMICASIYRRNPHRSYFKDAKDSSFVFIFLACILWVGSHERGNAIEPGWLTCTNISVAFRPNVSTRKCFDYLSEVLGVIVDFVTHFKWLVRMNRLVAEPLGSFWETHHQVPTVMDCVSGGRGSDNQRPRHWWFSGRRQPPPASPNFVKCRDAYFAECA